MLIQKGTKHPITNDEYPNSNWMEILEFDGWENYETYDDNSELGQKILKHAPFYDEVRDEETGELIDITSTERPIELPPEPTEMDYLLELDYRLSMIELGL
jgi:hypothetical protein